jgi:hypothetical protein
MDPYLENPAIWPDVHHRLIDVASEFLLAALRPKYFVQIDERLYVADHLDTARSLIIPDLHIREAYPQAEFSGSRGGSAMTVEPGIELESLENVEVHESRIQILDREKNQVVTVLEILSPANKVEGSAGRESYRQERKEVIQSETSLVEIDLLRMAPPLYTRPDFERFDFMAMVSRWTGKRRTRHVWPMRLQEKLKPIPIPVRPGDADAILDLQAMLDTAYQRAGYELRVDYGIEPIPPFASSAMDWSKEIRNAK